jgi:hypothetical protein
MKNTFITVFLILIAFSLGLAVDTKTLSENNFTNIIEKTSKNNLTYESPFGFSFDYVSEMRLENSSVVLPGGLRVSAVAVVRYVEKQNCQKDGLSQNCKPFLENPGIAFGVIDEEFSSLKNRQLRSVVSFSEKINLADTEGIQYYAELDDQGLVTIVLPFKTSKSLIIQYTVDKTHELSEDENVYKVDGQKIIIDSILSTLKID